MKKHAHVYDGNLQPCSQCVLAIFKDNRRPNAFVDVVLFRETFLKFYDYQIQPMLGEEIWPNCNYAKIKPQHNAFKSNHSMISINVLTMRHVTKLLLSGMQINFLKIFKIVPYGHLML